MKEGTFVRCADVYERNELLELLLNQGYRWHGDEDWDAEGIEDSYPFSEYPIIQFAEMSRTYGDMYIQGWEDIGNNDNAIPYQLFKMNCRKPVNTLW